MTLDTATAALRKFQLHQHREEADGGPSVFVGPPGEIRPKRGDGAQPQVVEEQRQAGGIDIDRAYHAWLQLCDDASRAPWAKASGRETVTCGTVKSHQLRKVALVESGAPGAGQFGLTRPVVSKHQQAHHDTASGSGRMGGNQRLPGAAIGDPGKELVSIDEVEERHGLAAQDMIDVQVVDHVAAAIAARAGGALPTREGQDQDPTQQAFEPVLGPGIPIRCHFIHRAIGRHQDRAICRGRR
jgi:hypothetical protein